MDGQKFDDITRALATGTSRRKMLKGLTAGALAAAFGLRRGVTTMAAPTCRSLGEACKPGPTGTEEGTCCSGQNLFCQKVAETGADRCECATGFVRCNGQCVSISCPGGGQLNTITCGCDCPTGTELCDENCLQLCPTGQSRNFETCACECDTSCSVTGAIQDPSTCTCSCPSGTEECNGACVANTCSGGQTFDPVTCSCQCAPNEVFCGGQCHNPETTCAGLHNKIFNIECCNQGANPCQNPGQPSGRCKA